MSAATWARPDARSWWHAVVALQMDRVRGRVTATTACGLETDVMPDTTQGCTGEPCTRCADLDRLRLVVEQDPPRGTETVGDYLRRLNEDHRP